ncbi:MAG: ATP-binding protein [Planctomycetota bacterium]
MNRLCTQVARNSSWELTGYVVRLRQAIMNLAGNAIKFTDEGSVQILARTERDSGSLSLAIDVIDTGIGISDQAQAKVFEPFAQADTSITRRFGGTGLGLAISKQLAEAMGGRIDLQSTLGKGTTFTIVLPLGDESAIEMFDPTHEASNQSDSGGQQQDVQTLPPCRILVADDGSPNRKLMKVVLGKAGADVVTVENGQLALDAALNESFDIVLMDMQMPVMDGYNATRRLREAGYTRPILALTANAMQGDQEKCLAAGCSGFLTKPIQIDRLLATLTTELEALELSGERVECHPTTTSHPKSAPKPPTQTTQTTQTVGETASSGTSLQIDSSAVRCRYSLEDPDFLEIAEDFVRALKERLPSMKASLRDKEFDELAADAHWLKGVSGSAGYDAFVDPSIALNASAASCDFAQCQADLTRIESLANRIDLVGQLTGNSPRMKLSDTSPNSKSEKEMLTSSLPMDDPDYREIVIDFAGRVGGKLEEMEAALAADDWETLAQLAHWLKGTSGTVGFEQFRNPTVALETMSNAMNRPAAMIAIQDLRSLSARLAVPV